MPGIADLFAMMQGQQQQPAAAGPRALFPWIAQMQQPPQAGAMNPAAMMAAAGSMRPPTGGAQANPMLGMLGGMMGGQQGGGMPPLPAGAQPATAPKGGNGFLDWLNAEPERGKASRSDQIAGALLGFAQGTATPGAPWLGGATGALEGLMGTRRQAKRDDQQERMLQLQELGAKAQLARALRPGEAAKPQIFGSESTGYYSLGPDGKPTRLVEGVTAPDKLPTTFEAAMLAGAPPEQRAALAQSFWEKEQAQKAKNAAAAAPRINIEGAKIMQPEVRGPSLTYEADKEQLKSFAGAWGAADRLAPDVNAMVDIALKGAQTGGQLAPLRGYLTNLATSVGIELSPEEVNSANDQKLFNQIASRLTPQMRVAGSGTTSDRDMQMMAQSIPQVTDTKQQQVMMALALKQANDWLLNSRDVVTAHLQDPKTGATLAGVNRKMPGSWLPRMTKQQAQASGQPVLFMDTETGQLTAWDGMP